MPLIEQVIIRPSRRYTLLLIGGALARVSVQDPPNERTDKTQDKAALLGSQRLETQNIGTLDGMEQMPFPWGR